MFALVDCNNFYASCERVFKPDLQQKPIAILSNNDGCVIARSDEAKQLGLPMGAPAFKYQSFFKEHNVAVFSSNYPLYGDMSDRVMTILSQFTPKIEIYSIDEAFLQFEGFELYNFESYALEIRQRILKWTGIPTCVGMASTKALSKVANKIARKFPQKTNGVYIIDSEEKRIKALKWTKIEDVWGIGRRLKTRLSAIGCQTAYDFTQLEDDWILNTFSITEWKLKKDLEGISKINLDDHTTSKHSIATTRTFESTYTSLEDIKERVATFAVVCAEKLRKQQTSCHMMIVQLSSDKYVKNDQQHHISKTIYFSCPTNSTLIINKAAVTAVKTMFKQGVAYKRAGIILTGLVPTNNHQLNLFVQENPKHNQLMNCIDLLNRKYKTEKVKIANQDLKRTWKMKQQFLSSKYTTNINEILRVK